MLDLRCLFSFHEWDGNTDPEYPAPRCRRCGRFFGMRDALVRGALVGIAIVALVWLLAGCACGVRDPRDGGGEGPGTLAAELASLGSWSLWLGGAIMGLGVVLRIGRLAAIAATVAAPVLGIIGVTTAAGSVIAGLAGAATEIGIYAIAIGIASLWAADHVWLLVVAGVAAGLACAYRHRRGILRWLRLGANPDQKGVVKP